VEIRQTTVADAKNDDRDGGGAVWIDMDKGIRRFGGLESYLKVLRSYLQNTPLVIETVKGIGLDDLGRLAIHVHGIKGSSRGVCAFDVGDSAEAIENAAMAGERDFVRWNLSGFIESVQKLLTEIDGILSELAPRSSKQKKLGPDAELLVKLISACEQYDMDGAEMALSEIDAYEYEQDEGLAAWLQENLLLSNFEQIKERLIALTDRR
jgi:HPt (histidine-containing phosphotransfer) domain-containing protein